MDGGPLFAQDLALCNLLGEAPMDWRIFQSECLRPENSCPPLAKHRIIKKKPGAGAWRFCPGRIFSERWN